MSTAVGSAQPRRPGLRLSSLLLLSALVLGAAGVTYLLVTSGTTIVLVADGDLPAYHQLVQGDLRPAPVDRRAVPSDAVRTGGRDAQVGRYTLGAVSQNDPVRLASTGPRLPAEAVAGRPVLALPAGPESSLGGRLARGDQVDVVLSPTAPGRPGRRITGVRVLDLTGGPSAAVVVSLTSADVDQLAAARGTSTIVLVRVSPYSVP